MISEAKFVLKLVKSGQSAEDVELVMKHFFGDDGRLNMQAAAVQTAICKSIFGDLVTEAKALESKKADKE